MAGAYAAIRGVLTVGQLTSFLNYANQYTKPFNEISGVATEFQNALASAARVFELIDEEPTVTDAEEPLLPDRWRAMSPWSMYTSPIIRKSD